jgi:hypothetical protein
LAKLALESVATGEQQVLGLEAVAEDHLACPIFEAQRVEPLAVVLGPGLAPAGVVELAPKQKLREPVARPHQVDANVLASAD